VQWSGSGSPDREAAGFWDSASWEEIKKKGDEAEDFEKGTVEIPKENVVPIPGQA